MNDSRLRNISALRAAQDQLQAAIPVVANIDAEWADQQRVRNRDERRAVRDVLTYGNRVRRGLKTLAFSVEESGT